MTAPPTTIRAQFVDPKDDCVVALTDLTPGETVSADGKTFTLREAIPAKHKFTARDFSEGERVTMYGVTVGTTNAALPIGSLLTTANLAHATDAFGGKQGDCSWTPPATGQWESQTWMGYHREDGNVGTANHWLVIPLVFCENRNLAILRESLVRELGYGKASGYQIFAAKLAALYRSGAPAAEIAELQLEAAQAEAESRVFPNVDGIKFLEHGLGCGGTRQDAEALCGLLAGYINHPNVAGATVLSLGCQNAQVQLLEDQIRLRNPNFSKPLQIFEQQKCSSEKAMISDAMRAIFSGMAEANKAQRQPASISDLTIGVECGGSDGFSGISANPVIGSVSDLVVALGGSIVLSEFPELCGVEQSLADRCVTAELAERFVHLMRTYNQRAEEVGSGFHANPSPGNIADGLITDAIKSAGAARKGGTSPVLSVLDYPETVRSKGLTLLCSPGNDVESTTAMAGSGANLMLFSTGLGTPTGNPIVPTIKLATNTDLATRLADIIDFDAGPVIRGERSVAEMGEDLLGMCLRTASGDFIPAAVRLGQDDFLPWKRGVSL
ncbi:MAG: altronate dehydratase [Verrucomicrobiae bacterium]|nr:altronate dehydratase [Verrucomicrobiae bacterium]